MTETTVKKPLTLRCGLTLPNRLVKASMSENLPAPHTLPDTKILNVYRHWAEGGWGMLITGNVQVDDQYLGTSTDLSVDSTLSDSEIIKSWTAWSSECGQHGTPTVMQLNHPGRQCPIGAGKRGLFTKNLAPSAVGLNMGPGTMPALISKLAFGVPKELTTTGIETVVMQFARAASLAAKSGFAGVEIHASHGYLLDQFLTAKTNHRRDAYGGDAAARAKLAVDIISAIRDATPAGFCIGILMGSVGSEAQSEVRDRFEQLTLITDVGVDYVHVSGGTFEVPTMFLGPELGNCGAEKGSKDTAPFFVDFAQAVKSRFPETPVIVTGGFRDRKSIESSLSAGACDLVGLVRPAAVNPHLPKTIIFNNEVEDRDASLYSPQIEAPWIIKQVGVTALNVHMDNVWLADDTVPTSQQNADNLQAWYLGHVKRMSKEGARFKNDTLQFTPER